MAKSFSFSKAVRKIRLPTRHGADSPGGTSTFQSRLVSAPNRMGGLSFSATPEEFGPRNCGQAAVAAQRWTHALTVETVSRSFIVDRAYWTGNRTSTPERISVFPPPGRNLTVPPE